MFRPDIFTNGHADFSSLHIKRLDAVGGLEVTLLVEDIISGQKRFVRFADRFAPLEQSGGVAERFTTPLVSIDIPDQQRSFADARMKFLQNRKIFRDKTRLKNQVLRRISGDRELGSQHQFSTCGSKALISTKDQIAIPAQITYRRVDLSKTDLHAALMHVMRIVAGSNSLLLKPRKRRA